MKRIALALITAAACGGGRPAAPVEAPAATTVPATTAFALGEATIVELAGEKPVFKLHASGAMETLHVSRSNPTGSWMPGGTLRTDGTIEYDGKPVMTIARSGVVERGGENNRSRLAIDGNRITIEFPTPLTPVVVELAADGTITLSGDRATKMGPRFRIDVADPAVRHTAFLVFAPTLVSQLD